VRLDADVTITAGAPNSDLVVDGWWIGGAGPRTVRLAAAANAGWRSVRIAHTTLDPGGQDADGAALGPVTVSIEASVQELGRRPHHRVPHSGIEEFILSGYPIWRRRGGSVRAFYRSCATPGSVDAARPRRPTDLAHGRLRGPARWYITRELYRALTTTMTPAATPADA
jgi:hypothetical protein